MALSECLLNGASMVSWKGKDVPLFDSNTWQWFWQFEGKPVSAVKPFHGPLAGTFEQECRVQGKQGWREQEAGFTLFISAVTVNCAHGCIYTVLGSLCFTEHRPGANRERLEKRSISRCCLLISAFSKLWIHPTALVLPLLSTYYVSSTMWSTWPFSFANWE